MSLGMKSRIYGLAIWTVVMTALASSLTWPSDGLANVATLAMVALNVYYAFAIVVLGTSMSLTKHEDDDKRSRSLAVLCEVMAARDKRSVVGRIWSVIECVSITVLAAYSGMLFFALLYAFLSMIIRLQYVTAGELVKPKPDASEVPA